MIIRSLQAIAGFEVVRVRALLRWLARDFWTKDDVVCVLKATPPQAAALIAALRSAGYVERAPSQPKGVWRNTVAGNALASATAAKPIFRQTGEDRLARFLGRVQALNANDECAYRVTKVVLFGSYLTSKTRLSDVDLAIRLEPRPQYRNQWPETLLARAEGAARRGRRFSTFVDRLGWAQQEAKRFLKARSRSLSLHDLDKEESLFSQIPHRVIFEEPV